MRSTRDAVRMGRRVAPDGLMLELSPRECLERAVAAARAGTTVVTVNARAARLVKSRAEAELARTERCWRTPDVLPLDALLRRLWDAAVVAGRADRSLLSSQQQWALGESIFAVEQATVLHRGGIAVALNEAWALKHAFRIPLGRCAITDEGEQFIRWAETYAAELATRGWTDEAQLADELRRVGARDLAPPNIAIYGFDRLTPQQREWLESLRPRCQIEELTATVPFALERAGVVRAKSPRNEFEEAARWARARLEADPEARIGVIARNLAERAAAAEDVFSHVLHPERYWFAEDGPAMSAPTAFHVSVGPSLAEYDVIRIAITTIEMATGRARIADAGAWLRSTYLLGGVAERERRAQFDLWMEGAARWDEISLVELLALMESRLRPSSIESLSQLKSGLRRALDSFPRSEIARPSDWAESFANLLLAFGWPGDAELGSAEYQALRKWNETLSAFGALDSVVPLLRPQDAAARLIGMVRAQRFRPEDEGAAIQVLDASESHGSFFDHLWVAGVTSDQWPSPAQPNPFIPFLVQREFKIPGVGTEERLDESRRDLARLLHSAGETVMLSWPADDGDGAPLRHSGLINGVAVAIGPSGEAAVRDIAADAAATVSLREEWLTSLPAAPLETWTDDRAPELQSAAGAAVHGGTSLLRDQGLCPFRGFAIHRLHAKPFQEPILGFGRRDHGDLVETALQVFWEQTRDRDALCALFEDSDQLCFRVQHAVASALDLFGKNQRPPEPEPAWAGRIREIERGVLEKLLKHWLAFEKVRPTPFSVLHHQYELGYAAGALRLKLRVDRIDQLEGGTLAILDYKTGESGRFSPTVWKPDELREPQLPLYAVAVDAETREGAKSPVGALAFALVRMEDARFVGITEGPVFSTKAGKPGEFGEHLRLWPDAIHRLAAGYAAGDARVEPLSDACESCHLQMLCRVNERAEAPSSTGETEDDSDGG